MTEENKDLLMKFLREVKKYQKEATLHPDFEMGKNNHSTLSKKGIYLNEIFKYYSRMNDLTSDLEHIVIFLRRFPYPKFYYKNDINQLDYIKYHSEVFIHKIHTILEVKKMLLNCTYELGLNEKDCSWENLKNQKGIKGTEIAQLMNSYHKTFKHIINVRHHNTHRATYNDKDSDDISLPLSIYENHEKLGLELDDEFKTLIPKFILDYQVKKLKKERINYIKDGINSVNYYSTKFMNIIFSESLSRI